MKQLTFCCLTRRVSEHQWSQMQLIIGKAECQQDALMYRCPPSILCPSEWGPDFQERQGSSEQFGQHKPLFAAYFGHCVSALSHLILCCCLLPFAMLGFSIVPSHALFQFRSFFEIPGSIRIISVSFNIHSSCGSLVLGIAYSLRDGGGRGSTPVAYIGERSFLIC